MVTNDVLEDWQHGRTLQVFNGESIETSEASVVRNEQSCVNSCYEGCQARGSKECVENRERRSRSQKSGDITRRHQHPIDDVYNTVDGSVVGHGDVGHVDEAVRSADIETQHLSGTTQAGRVKEGGNHLAVGKGSAQDGTSNKVVLQHLQQGISRQGRRQSGESGIGGSEHGVRR